MLGVLVAGAGVVSPTLGVETVVFVLVPWGVDSVVLPWVEGVIGVELTTGG